MFQEFQKLWYKKWWIILLACIPLALIILLFSFHYLIVGTITNIVDGSPIQNIEVRIRGKITKTDIKGKFEFSDLPIYFMGNLVVKVSDKYEAVEPIKISFFKRNEDLKIQLVPTPLEMEKIHFSNMKQKQYGENYDLLHPDIQSKFSREDYIECMSKYDEILGIETIRGECKYGEVKFLPTWEYEKTGKIYNDVAEIQYNCNMTVQSSIYGERTVRNEGKAHWVKSEGYWRWFLSPEWIERISKWKEEKAEERNSIAEMKARDSRIVAAISQARTVMVYIGTVEDSYESFSCAHEDMKEICEEIKKISPDRNYPVIKQSKEGACIYSKLNAKEDYWYCADSSGRAGFIDSSGSKPAPGDLGFCDGKTFICPPLE